MIICQLQKVAILAFLITLFGGCSRVQLVEKKDHRLIEAKWNKLPLRFSDRNNDDQFVAHPFFDIDPNIRNFGSVEENNFNVNYFVSTPKESEFQYEFDLYSGKLYRERKFCSQDDIWENYGSNLMRPNFTQGFLPRVYDENKNPMRVIVISNESAIEPFKKSPTHFDEARIIGSLVIEQCENYPCDQKEKWKASQALVAISPRDLELSSLKSFTELKKKIDWNYAKAMLTNMHGYHSLGGKLFPAYRISKELNLKDSHAYFNAKSTVLSAEKLKELNLWRLGCMKMYDEMWLESQKIREMNKGQAEAFLKYFKEFYAKNAQDFYQCQKLVRPANIVEDHKRLWFFSYLQAFNLLERNGFYYSCTSDSWNYNPRIEEGKFYVDQNKELERCRAKNFEKAFSQAINGMSLMRNQINAQFRFVEYDNMTGGSHQRIYGWIYDKLQNYGCKNESKRPNQISFDIFPQDVEWENYKQDEQSVVL